MNKLIQEISTIVSQYGQDIVTEERFVNILKDLYPDRDHPEKFDILKAIIAEGISADMYTDCNVATAKSFLEKKAGFVSRKYGLDSTDIKQVLASLCIGCGILTIDEYNSVIRPNRPKPLPSKPQGKPKPSKNPQPSKPTSPADHPVTLRSILALIWSFLGLCAIPIVYFALSSDGWWPFWAIAVVAVIYFFTIIMSGFLMNEDEDFEFNGINHFILGAYICISLCAILFILIGPFICYWTRNSLGMFYGYYRFYLTESPTILTFVLSIICCLFAVALAWVPIDRFIHADNPKNFLRGALMVLITITILHIFFFALPLNEKSHYERLYQKEVERVEQERLRITKLKKERSAKKMDLSFMDFYLGQDFKQSLAILNDVKDYKSVETGNMDDLSYGLIMDSLRYDPIINRVARANTLWDNDEVKIYLFSNNDKLVAIEMITNHDIDSVVAIYSEKYGEPEYEPRMEASYPYYHGSEYSIQDPFEPTSESQNYSWTFMTNQIRVSSSSTYSDTHVLYIDHECEVLLGKWVAEQAIKRQEQQRKEDSIARQAAEAERQRLNKERLEKKQNHEKSIKQI